MAVLRQFLLGAFIAFAQGTALAQASGSGTLPAGVERLASIEGVSEYRLANGLRFLLIPDASQQTLTINITYLVGSRHEGYGESGMAHLLEHLLFRGTQRFPNLKGEFLKRGSRFNGSTSYDRTNYFQTLPAGSDSLDWALEMEADRMVNAPVSRSDLDAEMTVVRNEFESGENSPFSVLRERVAATAYLWHNYGRAVIGARADIENVPIERLQAFYRQHYQPDNAVLVVAGRFEVADAIARVHRHFSPVPKPARPVPRTWTVEPVQDGERQVTLRRVGDVQLVSAMYHMPPGTHSDYAAVDLLVSLIGHVPSGRLQKALVEPGLASFVFGSERQLNEAGSAYFGASLGADRALEPARAALLRTLEGFAAQPVTDDEVERARTRLLNEIELTVANSRSLALVLSEFAALGDWRMLYLHRDRLRAATTADVQRAALRYLKPSNRTVGLFLPTPAPDRAEIPAAPDLGRLLADYKGAGDVAQGEAFDPTPANIEARVIRRVLPGGMRLAMLPKKTRGGTVVAELGLRWGNEAAKEGRSAACGIASSMLMRGTQQKSREQIANEFARMKANVGVGGEGGSVQTTRENLASALRLVADVLRQPAFPEAEFEQLRQGALTSIAAQRSDPATLARLELSRHLNPYPPGHWYYSTTIDERLERLRKLTLAEVRRCHAELHGASNSELAVVGDFDSDELTGLATELFGDWKSPGRYERVPYRVFDAPAIDRTINTPDKANATFRAGLTFRLRDDHPDFPALVLGNYLLGGASDARLVRRVRERDGLSYSVGSFLSVGSQDESAEFGVFAIHAPENRDRVEAAVKEELARVLSAPFTTDEFEAGRKGLLQSRSVARNQDAALAGRLASYLVLGRTFAWDAAFEARIATLSADQVADAMRRHIDPGKLSIVKAGDFNKSSAR